MDLGESLEDTARREVREETGLIIGELKLLGVATGQDYYFKLENDDEIYSVTAIYASKDIKDEIEVNSSESIDVKFFKVGDFPQGITKEYQSYILPYITDLID